MLKCPHSFVLFISEMESWSHGLKNIVLPWLLLPWLFYYINDSMQSTKITHFSKDSFLSTKKKVSQLSAPLFLVLGAASTDKDNGTEPISIMFSRLENTFRGILDHSSMLNLTRSFIFFKFAKHTKRKCERIPWITAKTKQSKETKEEHIYCTEKNGNSQHQVEMHLGPAGMTRKSHRWSSELLPCGKWAPGSLRPTQMCPLYLINFLLLST